MDYDIYKPPQADLSSNLLDTVPFYVVSERKFLMLGISTFGLYYLYWFYQHWKNQKITHNENIWPIARAIFNIFFTHSLFKRISLTLENKGKSFSPNLNSMATMYVIFAIIGAIIDRVSTQSNPTVSVTYTLLSLSTMFPMIYATYKAQQAANIACNDEAGAQNSAITPLNILWMVVGILFWVMVLLGLYATLTGMIPAE